MKMQRMDIHLFSFVEDDDDECSVLALGEDEKNVLMLQLAYEFDEQDEALGWNTYCIVLPDGAIFYGGIQHCTLSASQLTLNLSAEASAVLEVAGFDLALHLAPDEYQALANALAIIFNVPNDRPELVIKSFSTRQLRFYPLLDSEKVIFEGNLRLGGNSCLSPEGFATTQSKK